MCNKMKDGWNYARGQQSNQTQRKCWSWSRKSTIYWTPKTDAAQTSKCDLVPMLGSLVRVESYPNLFLHNPHVKDFAAVGCVPGVGCLAVGPVTNRVLPVAGGPPLTRREYSAGRSLISLNMGVPRSLRFLQGAGVVTRHSFHGEAHLPSPSCPRVSSATTAPAISTSSLAVAIKESLGSTLHNAVICS
jgi:hypothetical protein